MTHATIRAMSRPPAAQAASGPTRSPILAAVLILLVSACGPANPPGPPASVSPPASPVPTASTPPSPQSSAELAQVYRDINAQVQAIRGLNEKRPVQPTIVSREEIAAVLRKQNDTDSPPALVAAYDRLYHAMGVLTKDAKLADVFLDLVESQVGGLYSPTDQKLYVVSKGGGVGPLEKFLYSHEYTHALQDQNFDLQKFQPPSLHDQTDRQLARQALVEGDAYMTMTYWLQKNAAPGDMAAVLAGANDPKAQEELNRIPPLIASQITFAALQGTLWVLQIQVQGGYAGVNGAFADPPDSTEQILHPDKWASREAPIAVNLPSDLAARLGAGWSVGLEDTFGEHELGVWITNTPPSTTALPGPPPESAAGWGGDRVALLDGPAGRWAVVLKTVWDTAADAAEFETAIAPRIGQAAGPGQVFLGEGGTVRWVVIGSDANTLQLAATILGLAG
jgi:hypothetical protein